MRARYCMEVGGFPTYTMCEDFALALEFQAKGLRSAYVQEYLAVGEVPTTIRGTFQQRSRYFCGGFDLPWKLLFQRSGEASRARCLSTCMGPNSRLLTSSGRVHADWRCAHGSI